MRPVILAAGKGERYDGETIKPLMTVKERPVLLDALYTLGKMGFGSDEIIIAVNEDNGAEIRRAIGDSAINLVIQEELTGPATAVKAAYETDRRLHEALVIQADDASWFDPIMRDFALFHDRRRPVASMALLATGDPGVHRSTYSVDAEGMITNYRHGLPQRKHHRQGCNAGVYVVSRNSFLTAYDIVGPPHDNDVGLPAVINHMIDNNLPVAGPVYEIPWKSANTMAGLDVARAISGSARDQLEKVSLAEVLAYTTRTS